MKRYSPNHPAVRYQLDNPTPPVKRIPVKLIILDTKNPQFPFGKKGETR